MNNPVKPEISINNEYEKKLIEVSLKIIHQYEYDRKLNVSKIANDQGVSRAWIYKYFGPDTNAILKTSVEMIAPLMTDSKREKEVWKNNTLSEWIENIIVTLEITVNQLKLYPILFKFYLHQRIQKSEVSTYIMDLEKRYVVQEICIQLESILPKSTFSQRLAVSEVLMALKIGLLVKWIGLSESELDTEILRLRETIPILIQTTLANAR